MRGICHRTSPLCQTFPSSKRFRPLFRPFAGPASLTRESAQTVSNARGAVLSTPENANTATDRPLQELLQDQLQLHQLQREGVPEQHQAETLPPTQAVSSDQTPDSNNSIAKQAASKPGPAKARRSGNSRSFPRTKQRSDSKPPNSDGQVATATATASGNFSRRSRSPRRGKQKPSGDSLDGADPSASQPSQQAAAAATRPRNRSNSKSRLKQQSVSGTLDQASPGLPAKPAQASTAAAKTIQPPTTERQIARTRAAENTFNNARQRDSQAAVVGPNEARPTPQRSRSPGHRQARQQSPTDANRPMNVRSSTSQAAVVAPVDRSPQGNLQAKPTPQRSASPGYRQSRQTSPTDANRSQGGRKSTSQAAVATPAYRSTQSDLQVKPTPAAAYSRPGSTSPGGSNATPQQAGPAGYRQDTQQGPSHARALAVKRARYYSNPLDRERQPSPGTLEAAPVRRGRQPPLLSRADGDVDKMLSVEEDLVLCSAIQDAAFIEQQRRLVYFPEATPTDASPEESSDAAPLESTVAAAAPAVDGAIRADDYQRLKKWKDAVGAQTFNQLHQRLDRGERAKQMLLHYHKGLVRSFVWRVKRQGSEFPFNELVGVGEVALLKAAVGYDTKQNLSAKFSTYAYTVINRAISRYMMEHEDVVRLPVSIKELNIKINQAKAKFYQEWDRKPTGLEIAKEIDQPLSRVVLALAHVKNNPLPIEAQYDAGGQNSLLDLLCASIDEPADEDSREVAMSTSRFTSNIEEVLESLPEREGEVIALRYGIFTGKPQSLASISQLFGLSQEAIRKNELSAFRTLRETGQLAPLMSFLSEVEVQGNKPTPQPSTPMR